MFWRTVAILIFTKCTKDPKTKIFSFACFERSQFEIVPTENINRCSKERNTIRRDITKYANFWVYVNISAKIMLLMLMDYDIEQIQQWAQLYSTDMK